MMETALRSSGVGPASLRCVQHRYRTGGLAVLARVDLIEQKSEPVVIVAIWTPAVF